MRAMETKKHSEESVEAGRDAEKLYLDAVGKVSPHKKLEEEND